MRFFARTAEGDVDLEATTVDEEIDEVGTLETASQTVDIFDVATGEVVVAALET